MTRAGQGAPVWPRFAAFWLTGLIGVLACLLSGVFLLIARGPLPVIAVPVVGCFVISLAMGLWTKNTPIIIRAMTAVSCVAIPGIVIVLVNFGIDL